LYVAPGQSLASFNYDGLFFLVTNLGHCIQTTPHHASKVSSGVAWSYYRANFKALINVFIRSILAEAWFAVSPLSGGHLSLNKLVQDA